MHTSRACRRSRFSWQPAHCHQHNLHRWLHSWSDPVQSGCDLCTAADLFPGHGAFLGRVDNGDSRGAQSTGNHGHPVFSGAGRVQYVFGHPLCSGVMVYGTGIGETKWNIHSVGTGGNIVWGVHTNRDTFVFGWCFRIIGLEIAVYRESPSILYVNIDHGFIKTDRWHHNVAHCRLRLVLLPRYTVHNTSAVSHGVRSGHGRFPTP